MDADGKPARNESCYNMNLQPLNRKASCTLAIAALVLIAVQQYRINQATRNEASADRVATRLAIENADLRKRLELP